MKKEDIKMPELQNVEVDVEKFPKAIRDAIKRQGEKSFLQSVVFLIKKHTTITFDKHTKTLSLNIAGITLFKQEIK